METVAETNVAAPQDTLNQPLRLTERAVAQVKEVIKTNGFDGYYLSVRVTPAGCSGLGYDLNLIKEVKSDDVIWEQDGVRMVTDAMSTVYLSGTEVDYVSDKMASGFKFSNPNAKSSCGCGSSFST